MFAMFQPLLSQTEFLISIMLSIANFTPYFRPYPYIASIKHDFVLCICILATSVLMKVFLIFLASDLILWYCLGRHRDLLGHPHRPHRP